MGCGKTLTAIAVMGAAYQAGKLRRVLVVAPTSVCSVWPMELEECAAFPHREAVLLGTKAKRLKALESLKGEDALLVAVINYESVWRDDILDSIKAWGPDMVIADESQRIKDHKARQAMAMHELGDLARYKLILSGTPVQNNVVDLFSQYRFLDQSVFGSNFYAFRERYCVMGGFNRKQIVKYKHIDDLIQREHSIAYRVTKAEALDLPEQTFETRLVPLSDKARKLYDQLRREGYAELDGGGEITAATVLAKLLRLQQFTGGFLQPDGGGPPQYMFPGKIEALEDILEDYVIGAGKKLVIFCRFRNEIELIRDLLFRKGLKYGCIYGDVKQEDRGDIVREFQEDPETMAFLAQIDTAGLGITLTAADTCVYYSLTFNYGAYSQSLARIHRIGQKHPCTYIHLMAEKTVDGMVMKALEKKEDLAKTVVDDWRKYFE